MTRPAGQRQLYRPGTLLRQGVSNPHAAVTQGAEAGCPAL